MQKCLLLADAHNLETVIFPLLGVEHDNFPPRETAKAMAEAVKEYQYLAFNSCLKNVVVKFRKEDKVTEV